ncbi:MAG: class I SAM-dependent DNA methyltransferase, partial [Paraclostridium bifermentans]
PSTYAIAKADMLIKGGNPENMKLGDTLSDDKFKNYTFDYIISNPPFGINWKKSQKAVNDEHKQGDNGRFGVGLPGVGDGQMLFTLNGIKKLKDNGKMAIIHNGSPLFSGDAGSGQSEIRRYIIENDWLDAIIQLSTDAFYNTGITTYIWIISKDKPAHRKGKIQLIDASNCFKKRRKSIGNKRNDITEECREVIVKAYGEFDDKEYILDNGISCESKIFDNIDFGYNKIVIETPQLDDEGNVVKKGKKIVIDKKKKDTENVPLEQDIDAYFVKNVKPFNELAFVDKNKSKVGYEIPFTRYFYKYTQPEKASDIAYRISNLENDIRSSLNSLFAKDGE